MAMDFLAGCAGGAAGVLVGHPFDTVKVRLQVQNSAKPLYRGTFHCFQSIIRQETTFGLYKGIGSPMMGLTFINALVFGVQGNVIRLLENDTPLNQFLAGSAAGAMQCVICCPMELAKTRMQLQGTGEYKSKSKNYKNSLDCLVKIHRKEGLRGVNRGMVSTFLRETPSFGFYFLTYDCLTRYLSCEPNDNYIIPKLLLAGGMSGIVSWLSTYPIDVIKSRLQADGVGGVNHYNGILDCIRKSYEVEGWRVFTRGLTSTLLRAFPVNATTFATVTLFLMYVRAGENIPECDAGPCGLWRYVPIEHIWQGGGSGSSNVRHLDYCDTHSNINDQISALLLHCHGTREAGNQTKEKIPLMHSATCALNFII